MSAEVYQALADIVGLFPRVVIGAVGLVLVGVLVAAAAAEVLLRYAESAGESGSGEYSRLDRLDGLTRTRSFPSHVSTGREVTPPAGVLGHRPAGVETPGRQSVPPAARRPAVTGAPSQPVFPPAGAGTGLDDPLLSAGLPPGYCGPRGVRWP